MDLDDARAFLREHHRVVLATRRADGRPQLSPVVATIGADGDALVSTTEDRAKTHNVRRDPRVSLCAFVDEFYGPWLQVDGRATVVSLPEAEDLLVETYRSIAGEHPDWDDYRAAMRRERRVVLRVALERAGGGASA